MKSTAPSIKALMVASAPSWVRELTMTTGVGLILITSASAFSPSITGISTSMVTTSGFSAITC